MKNLTKTSMIAAATATIALALPALASAHPSVYTSGAKLVPSPAPSPVTWPSLLDQTRYVVSNHGYTYVLRESNGVTTNGTMDYKSLPGGYRSQPAVTTAEMITNGSTGAQPHATCTASVLNTIPAIEGWQESSGAGKPEPFYAYVPFQKTDAGLGDDPAHWIDFVKTQTSDIVDLNTVSDDPATATTQLTNLCTSIGGTFVPADAIQTTAASLNSGTIADATASLTSQVAGLNGQVDQLETDKTELQGDLSEAQAATQVAQAKVAAKNQKISELRKRIQKLRSNR